LSSKLTSILAFDFGMVRIGVALANTDLKIPHPIFVITGKNKFEKFAKIKELVDLWKPSFFVVGMPLTDQPADENPEKMQLITNIKRFSNRLKEQFKLDVIFVNEEYSSVTASAKLNEQQVFAKQQKDKLDAIAACLILQRYFDEICNDI
jgi:putative holliday junction resolvase